MYNHFGVEFEQDPHKLCKGADFSVLDMLYEGKRAYFGDYHCHAATGGSSDGKTTLENWLHGLKELKMDFAGIMDHRQVRHLYLDEFDPEYFLYGTEAGFFIAENPDRFPHYIMMFPERDSLYNVLSAFPDVFAFNGDKTNGPAFDYLTVPKARFLEVIDAVKKENGVFIHAHPKQVIQSEDPSDYYFGDGTVIETGYCYIYPYINNPSTLANYRLFTDMLNLGYKVYNTSTNDSHTMPMSFALNAVYTDKKEGAAFVNALREGAVNSGYIALKMSMDGNVMGKTVKYKDGMKLYIKIDDVHSCRFDKESDYRLEIVTDKGVAYAERITVPYKVALEVEANRRFYRAVVIKESDGGPAAIGNAIWIEK
ncbi:MAG: hypothetical protein IJD95_03090 [Clostridia bacterium]|nr:hypothetical protein [Clostridia bacterium]